MGAVRRNEGWILAVFGRVRRNGEETRGVTSMDARYEVRRSAQSAAKPDVPAAAMDNVRRQRGARHDADSGQQGREDGPAAHAAQGRLAIELAMRADAFNWARLTSLVAQRNSA